MSEWPSTPATGPSRPAGTEIPVRPDILRRWFAKVDFAPADQCWQWTGTTRRGRGYIRVDGQTIAAARVAYVAFNGDLQPGRHVRHTCGSVGCVNPHHLTAGSQVRRTHARGARAGHAKLSAEQVFEIRRRLVVGHTQQAIARDYGITQNAVSHIATGKTWAHLGQMP